jgi:hypothetical protein
VNVVFTDSLNAFKTVINPMNIARTRNIDIRYKWVIEQVAEGRLEIRHIQGVDMPADGLTKPLLREKHAQFVKMLGMANRAMLWADG